MLPSVSYSSKSSLLCFLPALCSFSPEKKRICQCCSLIITIIAIGIHYSHRSLYILIYPILIIQFIFCRDVFVIIIIFLLKSHQWFPITYWITNCHFKWTLKTYWNWILAHFRVIYYCFFFFFYSFIKIGGFPVSQCVLCSQSWTVNITESQEGRKWTNKNWSHPVDSQHLIPHVDALSIFYLDGYSSGSLLQILFSSFAHYFWDWKAKHLCT